MKTWMLLFVVFFSITVLSFADIKLPAIISDNMVLQQESQATLWGWADAGEKVTVMGSWQASDVSTITNTNGKWMLKIKTPKAGGPYDLTFQGEDDTLQIKNVLIGEVWLCSGQSNMRWIMAKTDNAEEEIVVANYPNIRFIKVAETPSKTLESDCRGQWSECNPENIRNYSAVSYYFGKNLYKSLNVPIGLIGSYMGGSTVEAWMKEEVLRSDVDYSQILERKKEYHVVMEKYEKELSVWKEKSEQLKKQGLNIPEKPQKPKIDVRRVACLLYNGMLNPIIPYRIKGVIWYQGEGNTIRAFQYNKLFPEMIKSWRAEWGQGDFPFYYVQIAPYRCTGVDNTEGAELREAQLNSLSVPNTGMAVIVDTVDSEGIRSVHPTNKHDVGKRLALQALAKTYGYEIDYSGPIYKNMKIEGDKIRLFFDFVADGLICRGDELKEFKIAGKDKVFFVAKAIIDGETLIVSNDKIEKPVAVRFAWRNAALPNLFNSAGLPASPFRTDDWPVSTINKK